MYEEMSAANPVIASTFGHKHTLKTLKKIVRVGNYIRYVAVSVLVYHAVIVKSGAGVGASAHEQKEYSCNEIGPNLKLESGNWIAFPFCM